MHDSFASIENTDQGLIGFQNDLRAGEPISGYDEVLIASRTMIGLYRAALSYRSEEAAKGLPKA